MSGRALIVDDNKVNRMLLRRGLAEQGIGAIEAEDGRQALDALASEPVDVILLDLVMPVLDGYATLEHIKADEALRHLPVIVITAVGDLESVVRCISSAQPTTCRSRSTRRSCGHASTPRWPASDCASSSSSTSSRWSRDPCRRLGRGGGLRLCRARRRRRA